MGDNAMGEVEDVLIAAGAISLAPPPWEVRDRAARDYAVKAGERVRLIGLGSAFEGTVTEEVGADDLRVRWDRAGTDRRPRRIMVRVGTGKQDLEMERFHLGDTMEDAKIDGAA